MEEGITVFCDGYIHHFYPGSLLGSGRRGVLYGRKYTQDRLVAASSLVTLVTMLTMSLWLQRVSQHHSPMASILMGKSSTSHGLSKSSSSC